MKKTILASVLALAGICGLAATGTRVYVSTANYGVASFLVSPDGTWTNEGKSIDPADGVVLQAAAMVRVGATYCVLDCLNAVGKFSIHRYDLAFNYMDTPVKEQAIATNSGVEQMAASPDGNFLYVTQTGSNLIRVDTHDWSVDLSFTTALDRSCGICVTPTGKIYASDKVINMVSAFDPETGARGTMHNLSQANGVYYDADMKLVYVGNEAFTLKVFNETDPSASGGVEYSDGTIIQNSRSIVKVGGKICMTRPRDGMIVAFDPDAKTFSEVCSTGLGWLNHLYVEEAGEAVVTARDGTVTIYETMAEAMRAVNAAGGAKSILVNSTGTRSGRDLSFAKPSVDVSGATPLFGSGTCASRMLTAAEQAAYIMPGLNVRHKYVDGRRLVYEWTDSPDAARVFVTGYDRGIKAYRVGFDGTWTDEGMAFAADTGVLAKPLALVRVGSYFYVLDQPATGGRFSIHRYDLQYGYVDTLVDTYGGGSLGAEQIDASPDGAYLYVTCSYGGFLLRIATKDGTVEKLVSNRSYVGLSVAPNGKIYVGLPSSNCATAVNPATGDEVVYHPLSQANGVYYDPDTKSVYVGNMAYSLSVFAETAPDWTPGTVYTDSSSIANSMSLARVGDKICMVRPAQASIVAFDPATGTFSEACATGWGPVGAMHVYADDPFSVFGVTTNGVVVAFTTFAEALEAGKDGSLSSLTLASSGYAQKPLQLTNPNVVETAVGLRLGKGTGLSRGLSVAENAAYVATGFYAKKSVTEGVTSFAVSPDGDAACALLTYPAYGVKRCVVASDGTWRITNDLFTVGAATPCRRPMSCIRVGKYYYVLDARSETFGGTFSIWKYSDRGRCRGALVDDAATDGPVFQMAASPDGSKFYVTTEVSGGGKILCVDVATGAVTTFTEAAVGGTTGICVASGGTVYSASADYQAATGYNTAGVHIWHLAVGGTAAGVWHDDDMGRLYAMSGGDYFRVFADGEWTARSQVSDSSLLSQSHAVAGLGGYVYFGLFFKSGVVRYEPETGALSSVPTGISLNNATHLFFETLPMPVYPSKGMSVMVR